MDGYMKNTKGHLVPIEAVKPIDRTRDELVRSIVERAASLAQELALFKAAAMGDIQAFIDLSVKEYQVGWGGIKGNVTLTSFDGEFQVRLVIADRLVFDERLQAAKALIDECLIDWTKGANPKLKAIIDRAFQVDKQGKINTGSVLSLRKLDIDDAKWKLAMEAISDSLTVAETKEYIRIYRRNREGEYDLVNLDVAA